ncbi:MAG: nicotinate mononucleotide-dependent phosphoribosyltransferase CobT [Promethearchaeota archaeon]
MHLFKGIIPVNKLAYDFIQKIFNKNPGFLCVLGNTETGKIPGISAAGANPAITDYTPPADLELLYYGKCKSIPGVPITPDGIPTPAIITLAAKTIADIPVFGVNGGLRALPLGPYIELGGAPGESILNGASLSNVKNVFERAIVIGKNFSKAFDYLVIGESIAGGTTTALAVMMAMGINASGKVSSSMSFNPHDLKNEIIRTAFKNLKLKQGGLKHDPLKAIELVGDPIQPVCAGLAIGATSGIPVILAGGTQMAAVVSIISVLEEPALENIAIGTTRWLIEDRSSDLQGLIKEIREIPILAINLNFSVFEEPGLRAYEEGVVKEGVGAGGMSISAIVKSGGKITLDDIYEGILKIYKNFKGKL